MSTKHAFQVAAVPCTASTRYDRYAPPVMLWTSLAFLVFFAGALQEASGGVVLPEGTHLYWYGMAALYPLFVGETTYLAWTGRRGWRRYVWHCLIPPLRMAARDPDQGTCIWMPGQGWMECNRRLRRWLDDRFALPMIGAALLILPLLVVDHYLEHHVRELPWLSFLVATGTSIVWLAFTIEFVVMFSATNRKVDYCRRHWLNLLIILLPMIAFLRVFRLTQLARLQQLTRLSRLYRLRGLSMRFVRALVAVDLVKRMLEGNPHKRLVRLKEVAREQQEELEELLAEIASLEARIAAMAAAEEDCEAESLVVTESLTPCPESSGA